MAATPLQRRPYTFQHTREGFECFREWLGEVGPGLTPVFGVEPTWQFTKVMVQWLQQQGWQVMTVPGVYVKRAKNFLTSHDLKTDAVDARVIADLVAKGHCRLFRDHQPVFEELRQLSEMYLRSSKVWADSLNRLHSFIDVLLPELTRIFTSISIRSPRRLLKAYPSPEKIAAEDPDVFCEFVRNASGGKVDRERRLALLEAARDSIGLKSQGIAFEMQATLKLLDYLEETRIETMSEIQARLEQVPYSVHLKSIPGFGDIVTGILLGQLGDLRDYPTANHLLKAADLNLVEWSSGKYKGAKRISHMGSPILRRYLYHAAISACCMKTSPFREWYQERVQHKPAKVVLVACMRRMLRIAHAIARDEVPFDRCRYSQRPSCPNEPENPGPSSVAIIDPAVA